MKKAIQWISFIPLQILTLLVIDWGLIMLMEFLISFDDIFLLIITLLFAGTGVVMLVGVLIPLLLSALLTLVSPNKNLGTWSLTVLSCLNQVFFLYVIYSSYNPIPFADNKLAFIFTTLTSFIILFQLAVNSHMFKK